MEKSSSSPDKILPIIVFPESSNPFIREAAKLATENNLCKCLLLDDSKTSQLTEATRLLADDQADGMVAGIDHTTRDVILAVRDQVGLLDGNETFTSLFCFNFPDKPRLILADGGVIKNPSVKQLADTIRLTHDAAESILGQKPLIAMLSFSTFSSGGNDPSIDKSLEAISIIRQIRPDIIIDGEMQLDAAVNPRVGHKKASGSPVAGKANVLITPDLNSGNILYKAIEQFGNAHAYGPVLLGFKKPVSDLSRGSTVDDIYGSISVVVDQIRRSKWYKLNA